MYYVKWYKRIWMRQEGIVEDAVGGSIYRPMSSTPSVSLDETPRTITAAEGLALLCDKRHKMQIK